MFANIEALENFIAQWEAGVLPKAQWTHAAHVAVGTFWAGIPTREVEGIEDPLAAVRQAVERYGDQRRLHERYYSFDVVKSVHARRSWMAPDLL